MDMSIFSLSLPGEITLDEKLFQAVYNGDLKQVKSLLENGASPFSKKNLKLGDKYYTALALAIEQNRIDIIQALLKKKPVRIIKQDVAFGDSAITFAIKCGRNEVLQLLLTTLQKHCKEAPLKVHLDSNKSPTNYSAFGWACLKGNLPAMEMLAKAGANTQDHGVRLALLRSWGQA